MGGKKEKIIIVSALKGILAQPYNFSIDKAPSDRQIPPAF